MTTPQETLRLLEYKIERIRRIIEGDSASENGERQDIYELMKGIEIEVSQFNERMQLLEDKMDIIIKLLGRSNG